MRRFSVAPLVLAAVAFVAAGCGDDNGGDSREEVEREIAGQRLRGCFAEAGFDFGDVEDELGEAVAALFERHEDADDLAAVDEFFTDLDLALSDDFSDFGLSDEFSDEVDDLSADYSEFDDETFTDPTEGATVDFVECLGFSQEDFEEFLEDLEQQFSDQFTDDFTDGGTTDEFTDDFS